MSEPPKRIVKYTHVEAQLKGSGILDDPDLLAQFEKATGYNSKITMKGETSHPEWLRGLFSQSMQVSSLQNVQVSVKTFGLEQCHIDITWN